MSEDSDSKPDRPKSAPKPPEQPKAVALDLGLRTPEEWAGPCGQRRPKTFEETVTKVNGKPFDVVGAFLWEHEAASVLHGWTLHAHHAGEPMKLSRADYEAALKAAGETNEQGEYTPHPAALSPHKPKPEAPAKGA